MQPLSVSERLDRISERGEWKEVVLVPSWRSNGCLHSVCDYFASHNSMSFNSQFLCGWKPLAHTK